MPFTTLGQMDKKCPIIGQFDVQCQTIGELDIHCLTNRPLDKTMPYNNLILNSFTDVPVFSELNLSD